MQLQEHEVATWTVPGKHTIAGTPNLYLVVRKSGSRSWVYRYNVLGKPIEHGIGSLKRMPLARAKLKAGNLAMDIGHGQHPQLKRLKLVAGAVQSTSRRFGDVHELLLVGAPDNRNTKRQRQQFDDYLSSLATRHVATITSAEFSALIAPHWNRNVGKLLQRQCFHIMQKALALTFIQTNPAQKDLLHLGKVSRKKTPRRAYPWRQVPALYAEVQSLEGNDARLLQALMLLPNRTDEMREAQWGEFDFAGAMWTVPVARMKVGNAHQQPLAPRTAAFFLSLRPANFDPKAYVFAGVSGSAKPVNGRAAYDLLQKLRPAPDADGNYTVHGFRSAFSGWHGNAHRGTNEARRLSLGQTVSTDTVDATYQRDDMLEPRLEAFESWEAYLMGAQVTPIRKAA